MERTLFKALIRRKTEESLANNSQKSEDRNPDRYFDDQTKKERADAKYSKERNGITPSAYLPEKEVVFPTKKFIDEIFKDIQTARHLSPGDSKFRTYDLQRLRVKPILANLKTDILKEIIKFEHCLNIIDSLKFIDGTILEFDKNIIFRLNLEIKARYSIVLDRKGETVNFCTLPKRLIDNQEQNTAALKFLDSAKIRALENRFFVNLIDSLDLKAEEDILKGVFGLQPSAKGAFIDGQMIRKSNEVFFEIVVDRKFKFSLIIDLYGNYLDITPTDSSSGWMSLLEEFFSRGAFFPAVNVFHSNMDCLF